MLFLFLDKRKGMAMNKLDCLHKAMQGHVEMSQHLDSLAKGADPLLAEVSRIMIRDAGRIKRELWGVTQCMVDEPISVLPIVQRYESTPLEQVSYAKVAADSMLSALTPLRNARSAPVSEVANRLFGETQLIADRLERVQGALFDQDFNPGEPTVKKTAHMRM
jgi:hypothetical protein